LDSSKGNKNSIHKAVVTWDEKNKSFLCSVGNKTIKVAASLGSKTHDDMLTPEELFVDSIEGFIKDTFMDAAKRNKIEVLSYESEGRGIVDKVENKLMFTEIKIRPQIVVMTKSQVEKAKELIELAGENFAIASLVSCKIRIYPEIKIGL
jgi:organic hydroperoxide reductase OsmC/OhrA